MTEAPSTSSPRERRVSGRIGAIAESATLKVDAQAKALKAAGRWDSTVVVFTGDHGEQLFDHWLLGKTGYFDASAHVPLIVRDPRPASDPGRGRVVEAFTESIDVMPTLLALAGRAPGVQIDRGPIVCACFDVGLKTILAAIADQHLADVPAIGAALKAGTNCGSCRPTLAKLLAEGSTHAA